MALGQVPTFNLFVSAIEAAPFWAQTRDWSQVADRSHLHLQQNPHYIRFIAEVAQRAEIEGVAKRAAQAEKAKAKADALVHAGKYAAAKKQYNAALWQSGARTEAERSFCAKVHCNRALCSLRGAKDAESYQQARPLLHLSLDDYAPVGHSARRRPSPPVARAGSVGL